MKTDSPHRGEPLQGLFAEFDNSKIILPALLSNLYLSVSWTFIPLFPGMLDLVLEVVA